MTGTKVYHGDSRSLGELEDGSVQLMVTSPPYWHIKDYGEDGQIGYGQSLHDYLNDLYSVWKEVFRVLGPGRKACINIGDQFLRASVFGRYKIVPLHAEIIVQMERIGFDFMGSIIWNKRTTMNTTGGASVMGSYPYPPNGIVEIDYEHILIFRKPGRSEKLDKGVREDSRMTKEEWKEFHLSHWNFGGARQIGHEAMFPLELPSRLVRMYSLKGETVLDPFLGSGTTAIAANDLDRNCIGYEMNGNFIELIRGRMSGKGHSPEVFEAGDREMILDNNYEPGIPEIDPLPVDMPEDAPELHKVVSVGLDLSLGLDDGRSVVMQGIEVIDRDGAVEYLESRIEGKKVFVREEGGKYYVHLKNRIFVNKELIRNGSCTFNGDESLSKAGTLRKAAH